MPVVQSPRTRCDDACESARVRQARTRRRGLAASVAAKDLATAKAA
jgi:hypothetical protein